MDRSHLNLSLTALLTLLLALNLWLWLSKSREPHETTTAVASSEQPVAAIQEFTPANPDPPGLIDLFVGRSNFTQRRSVASTLQLLLASEAMEADGMKTDLWIELVTSLDSAGLQELLASLKGTPLESHPKLTHLIFAHWSEVDPERAWQIAQSHHSHLARQVLQRWISDDPSAAIAAVQKDFQEAVPDWVRQPMIEMVARQDPREALQLAQRLSTGPLARHEAWTIFGSWHRTDPQAALETLLQTPVEQPHDLQLKHQSAQQWLAADPEAFYEWIAELPESESSRPVFEVFLEHLAGWDPSQAQDFAQTIEDPALKTELQGIVAGTLAQTDIAAAAAYAETMPDGQVQEGLMGELATDWLRSNPMEAAEWVAALPEGNARDAAVLQVVDHKLRHERSYEEAMAWASTLHSLPQRDQTISRIGRRWLREDPDLARTSLQQSPLSPFAKDQLLQNE